MRKILLLVCAALCASPTLAEQTASTLRYKAEFARGAQVARNALKKTGATGMRIAVDDCYRSGARQRGESAVLRCYAIHRSAGDLDEAFSRISGVDVREPSLTKGAALVRAINALKDRGVSEDTAYQTIAIWDFYGREDN